MRRTSKLKFDMSSIINKAKTLPKPRVENISINIPFLSVNLSCSDLEKKIAREVLIRIRDKRVLVSDQCCGGCIKYALDSIQDIRKLLVDKQVELPDENSTLFLLFDLMLSGIRQFLTLTERYEPYFNRDEYQCDLEIIRGHLLRCINEIAKVGNVKPQLTNQMNYDPDWDKEIYSITR